MQNFISTTQQVTFQAEIEHGFLTADVNDHLILTTAGHSVGNSEEGMILLSFRCSLRSYLVENAFTIVPLHSEGLKFLLYGAAVDIVHKMSSKIVTVGDGPGNSYFRLANAPREGIFKIISNSKKKRNDRV